MNISLQIIPYIDIAANFPSKLQQYFASICYFP